MKYSDTMLAKMPNADPAIKKAIKRTEHLIEELKEEHKDKVEKFLVALTGELSNGHFCEDSALWAIGRMKPVVLIRDGAVTKTPLGDYLLGLGISAETAKEHVRKAQETAKTKARSLGFEAPSIPDAYTKYDYLVTVAMMFSDYWMTIGDDMSHAFELAYQFLSDPDADDHHIWDYLME